MFNEITCRAHACERTFPSSRDVSRKWKRERGKERRMLSSPMEGEKSERDIHLLREDEQVNRMASKEGDVSFSTQNFTFPDDFALSSGAKTM